MKKPIKNLVLISAIILILGLAIFLFLSFNSNETIEDNIVAIIDTAETPEISSIQTLTISPSPTPLTAVQPKLSQTLLPPPALDPPLVELLNSRDYYYEESVFFECPFNEVLIDVNEYRFFDENNDLICMGGAVTADGHLQGYFFRIKNNRYEKISPPLSDLIRLDDGIFMGTRVYGISRDLYGNYYVIIDDYNEDGITHHLNIFDKDFNIVEADIPFDAVYDVGRRLLHSDCVFFDNRIYNVGINNGFPQLLINDVSGKKIDIPVEFSRNDSIQNINIDAHGNLYFMARENGAVGDIYCKVDLNTNRYVYNTNVGYSSKGWMMTAYSPEADSLYSADETGVYRYNAATGEYKEQTLKFGVDTSYIISQSNTALIDVVPDNMGNLYIFLVEIKNDQNLTRVLKYTLTPGNKPEAADTQQEIVFTANYLPDFINHAINNYHFRNKDVKIIPDVIYDTREEMSNFRNQAAANLAARIMANDVGDIVATGGMGLDYYNVLHTDAFVDLSEYVRNDKNYANLNQAALNSLTFDGKLNGLPVGIALHGVLEFNTQLNSELQLGLNPHTLKWSEILDATQSLRSGQENLILYGYNSIEHMLAEILITNMPDLINIEDKEYNLTQEWFIDLINDLKSVKDKENLFSNNTDMPFLFRPLGGRSFYGITPNNYKWQVETVPPIMGEVSRNRVAYTASLYSISARSENKDAAWAFLSFLLENEQMTIDTLDAVPLNNRSADILLERYSVRNDEEYQALCRDISRNIDFMYDFGLYKEDIVYPVMQFINDEITLDEALVQAEYNIWLRMNE